MSESSIPVQAISIFGPIGRSAAASLVGWAVMCLYLLSRYVQFAGEQPRWYAMPAAIATLALPYIAGAWILLVLPLFYLVPRSSRFWRWFFVAPCLGLLAFVFMASMVRFELNRTTERFVVLAALCGTATGLAGSLLQSRLRSPPARSRDR